MEKIKDSLATINIKIGDKVRIVEYGHLYFQHKKNYQEESDYFAKAQIEFNNRMAEMLFGESVVKEDSSNAKGKIKPDNIYIDCGDTWWVDSNPSIVGQEGIVSQVTNTQGRLKYAISGIKGKYAWYDLEQVKLVIG
jgi:hypothetical protein